MNAKEYLEEIEKNDRLIQNKIAELQQLRCLASSAGATTNGEAVQSSKSGDRLASLVVKIVDLENEINDKIDSYITLKNEHIKVIEQVNDALLYDILHKRYVQYKAFVEIAESEGYTYDYILECHQKALKIVRNIINNP